LNDARQIHRKFERPFNLRRRPVDRVIGNALFGGEEPGEKKDVGRIEGEMKDKLYCFSG